MHYSYSDYVAAKEAMEARLGGFIPEIIITLGSGLGFLADEVENPIVIPYQDIPHFKVSSAPGHKGQAVFGKLCGRRVVVMQGRLHCYEGYTMEEVTFPIRALKLVGASVLVLTNAAGCTHAEWTPGDLMLITDHIRLFGYGPLQGPNIEEFGPRFNDMSHVYTARLQEIAREEAAALGVTLREGSYMYFPGPNFETPAEVRAARMLGGDAVGMSTVPEATIASHAGMQILGITVLTNMAAGVNGIPLSGEEVNQTAARAAKDFSGLIRACLKRI